VRGNASHDRERFRAIVDGTIASPTPVREPKGFGKVFVAVGRLPGGFRGTPPEPALLAGASLELEPQARTSEAIEKKLRVR
jgi:hypothetical protein